MYVVSKFTQTVFQSPQELGGFEEMKFLFCLVAVIRGVKKHIPLKSRILEL